MRDRPSSSPTDLFISSTNMASTASSNVNELLPGLESFLRSMLSSTHLDTDHRQIAAMYAEKIDQLSKVIDQSQHSQQTHPTPIIDEQSLMNTELISDDSDDFTDEEEEQRQMELREPQFQQQQPQLLPPPPVTKPILLRRSSISENHLYHGTRQQSSNLSSSQWYIDVPKNAYLEPSNPSLINNHSEGLHLKAQSRASISKPASSTIIADGLLLTYDENHNWIWRYYVLDDYDLICFSADKKSLSTMQSSSSSSSSDNESAPLWVSDMTNAKVHTSVIDKVECLCLQIGVAEAIYVRPPDANQMNFWLKAFRDASSTKRSKENLKGRSGKKTLSRNARRMFAQFNRKKGQIVSHLLDHMANVTGVDEKTRKHCELRGFLVISLDNHSFVTKYCTIVDGIFRVHKSRLSDQTDHELCLNRCTLSFPEERTRDIQFALIDEQVGTIFIRGNNIYSMGRLLNTLAKYVEITGSSKFAFTSPASENSTPLNKHRQSTSSVSQTHLYSDVDAQSAGNDLIAQSNEMYGASNAKSISPTQQLNSKANLYHNAAKIHEDQTQNRPPALPMCRSSDDPSNSINDNNSNKDIPVKMQRPFPSPETYDRPKSYDNIAVLSTPVDNNNNHVLSAPQRHDQQKTLDHVAHLDSSKMLSSVQRSRSKISDNKKPIDPPSIPSSPENTVFCMRSSESNSVHSRNSRRRPDPIPRRSSTQTAPTDYVNKLANIFSKGFSISSSSSPPASPTLRPAKENNISTQTYETIPSSPSCSLNNSSYYASPSQVQNPYSSPSSMMTTKISSRVIEKTPAKRVYDIPITIERPSRTINTSFEPYQKPTALGSSSVEPLYSSKSKSKQREYKEEEETTYAQGYDNLSKNDGIGKFRFVVPFNHSPTSAFIASNSSKNFFNSPPSSSSSTISSYSTQRSNLTTSAVKVNNPNLKTNTSSGRSTLMTAV